MQPEWLPNWLSLVLEWIHQEQAIVAGLLALLGASATVFYLKRQINLQQEYWEDEKARRLRARRARLPLALSELIDYCHSCYSVCRIVYENYDTIGGYGDLPSQPDLPARAIEVLVETIEQSIEPDVSIALEEILSDLQVNHSRLKGTLEFLPPSRHIGNVNNKEALALRAYEHELLKVRVERLFEYARNVRSDVRPLLNRREAQSAFEFGHRNESEFGRQVEEYTLAYWPDNSSD